MPLTGLLPRSVQDSKLDGSTPNSTDSMAKLNPIQIFLTGDTETFLERAIKDRGENWARCLTQERCNSDDIRDLITYFNEMGKLPPSC